MFVSTGRPYKGVTFVPSAGTRFDFRVSNISRPGSVNPNRLYRPRRPGDCTPSGNWTLASAHRNRSTTKLSPTVPTRGYPDARRIESVVEDGSIGVEPVEETDTLEWLRDDGAFSDADAAGLALAKRHDCTAVIDDAYGRTVADAGGIPTPGTVFIVLRCLRDDPIGPDEGHRRDAKGRLVLFAGPVRDDSMPYRGVVATKRPASRPVRRDRYTTVSSCGLSTFDPDHFRTLGLVVVPADTGGG